jgi:hypothetical protein
MDPRRGHRLSNQTSPIVVILLLQDVSIELHFQHWRSSEKMQYEWIFALLLNPASLLIFVAVFLVVGILINALFLGIALGLVHGENREFGSTFVTALLMTIVSMIPILGCILAWYLIKTRHEVGWGGAIAAWLLTFIIEAIALVVIVFVVLLPFLLI